MRELDAETKEKFALSVSSINEGIDIVKENNFFEEKLKMTTRIEKDTMGEIEVPVDAYWRRRHNVLFKILLFVKRQCRTKSLVHSLTLKDQLHL